MNRLLKKPRDLYASGCMKTIVIGFRNFMSSKSTWQSFFQKENIIPFCNKIIFNVSIPSSWKLLWLCCVCAQLCLSYIGSVQMAGRSSGPPFWMQRKPWGLGELDIFPSVFSVSQMAARDPGKQQITWSYCCFPSSNSSFGNKDPYHKARILRHSRVCGVQVENPRKRAGHFEGHAGKQVKSTIYYDFSVIEGSFRGVYVNFTSKFLWRHF